MCILKAGGTYMSEKIKNAETALHNKVKSLYKGGNVTYAEQVCDFWITTPTSQPATCAPATSSSCFC